LTLCVDLGDNRGHTDARSRWIDACGACSH
jgi:hypothetical protein